MKNPTETQWVRLQAATMKFRTKVTDSLYLAQRGELYGRDFGYNMFIGDANTYISYCDCILSKNFKMAYNIQCDMDTSVRDGIPNSIYNRIESLN